ESLAGAALDRLLSETPPDRSPYEIDLQHGLEAAMRQLDASAAASVRLRWGRLVVGTIEPRPGAEPLRGRHLPWLLRQQFRCRLADVLALNSLLESEVRADRMVAGAAAEHSA